MISPSVTISRFSFAISRPMTFLPGMTSTTRTLSTDSARARSLARLVIWLAFTPGAGRSSKRVTTGPGCTATTSTSMPKSFSFISTRRDSASSASARIDAARAAADHPAASAAAARSPWADRTAAPGAPSRRARSSPRSARAARCAAARASRTSSARSSTASLRACLRSRPSATSRAGAERVAQPPDALPGAAAHADP